MAFDVLLNFLSILLALVFFITGSILVIRFKSSNIGRVLGIFGVALLSTLVWLYAGLLLYAPLANLFPLRSGVPCFILNEKNCSRRTDCLSGITIGGLGRDSFSCSEKLSQ